MSFLLQLRNAANGCSNIEYRAALKYAADELGGWVNIFYNNPSMGNMTALNGAWANATRMLKEMPPEGDPAPLGGHTEAARLAA
jgi:hypothetical protein